MKNSIFVFITAMMISGALLAQDVHPAVKSGSKSLNFTFGGLGAFGLNGTGPSGGLGISYFLTSDAAVRLGLQIKNASSTIPANPGVGQTGTDGSTSTFTLGISADYLMYMTGATSRVRPFMGAGLSFGMISDTRKNAVVAPNVQSELKGTGAGTTLGLMGIVGAEFFLYPELSLSAEYDLGLFSMLSPADLVTTTGPNSNTTKQTSSTTILGFGAGGATLHIYF
jgi:outer membrane protein W